MTKPDLPELKDCPVCEYPLIGLPRRHRCPECGFEYDEHTRIWQARRPWRLWKAVSLLMNGVAFCFFALGAYLFAFTSLALRWVAPVLAAFYACCFVYQWILNRRREYVAVTPGGVIVRMYGTKPRAVPWCDVLMVGGVGASAAPGWTVLHTKRGRYRIGLALRDPVEAQALAEAVEDGKKRYGAGAS
ncbi:MAG: hypothetical protein JXQ75_15390 [Phycisphaerae bacterium]|nr:hypothetical protein [Phycisphaerae bacterium]